MTFPYDEEYTLYTPNMIKTTEAFSTGVTTTETKGFERARFGTIIVPADGNVWFVTEVDAESKQITAKQISNA